MVLLHLCGKTVEPMLKAVDLLVEGCKGMVKFVNMQYVSIGVVINCYKFASAYLQGRVRIPIGGIVREPEDYRSEAES